MWIIIFLILSQYQIWVYSLELKSINSCQIPLLSTAKILPSSARLNTNTWCPLSSDSEPSLLISFPTLSYITRLSTQSSNFYYHLDYTRDYSIDSKTIWRSYRVLTTTEENLSLDPPMIARHIRVHLKPMKPNVCLQLELFGCIFTDGVVSYNMFQGSHQLEDEIYDGQYSEKHRYLYDGLGQLSDGQTGPDNYQDPQGLQWVGWRKPRFSKGNASIGILFTFDQLRNFSRLTIHTNNYFPKKIFAFRSLTIEFLTTNSSSFLTYDHQRDEQFEMARPIMINLKYHIASQLKIHLYFDSNWILLSEFTFDSIIIPSSVILPTSSIHYPIYLILCLSIMFIILFLPILLILLLRNFVKYRKPSFSPINSSISTTSSELDSNSSHHRYATVRSSPYAKLIPLATSKRLSMNKINNHIEGVCGNSAYGSERTFMFNFNQNLLIPNEKLHLQGRMTNRHQLLGGGEIYQGELEINQSLIPITVRRLLPHTSLQTKVSFANEMSLLISLCHPHILHAYGFCSEPNLSLITESSDMTTIDLYQYLQRCKQQPQPRETLLYSTVLFLAGQICSALAYLESLHVSHRDIAARNCLISSNLHVKLQDLAMSNEIYADDYVLLTTEDQLQTRRPIRWCAWETICLNRFTSKSDVFSFGVLLWEILTLAERPHSLFDDEEVLRNLRNTTHDLIIPSYAADLKEIISSCWNRYESARPSFAELNQYFNQKQQLLTISSENNYQQVLI